MDPTRFFKNNCFRHFNEFLIFGGYPRVVLEEDYDKKEKLLGEIVSSYIYKDMRSLFNIGDITKFNNLVKVLASQIGSLINISGLAQTIEISRQTVSNYISILQNSFVISLLSPYSRSKQVEIRKANKIYFFDNGIRNYIIGDLSPSMSRADKGALLENVVFNGLLKRKREMENLYFWRTKDKAEIDFVLSSGDKVIPLEVKTHAQSHRALHSFMRKYKVGKSYIAHLGEFKHNDISFIPAYWLA